MDEKVMCESSIFWEKGFVAFQAAINAAIIEVSIKLNESNCIINQILMDGYIISCLVILFISLTDYTYYTEMLLGSSKVTKNLKKKK